MACSGPMSTVASQRTTPAHGWLTSPGSRRYQLWRANRSPMQNTGVRCPAERAPITPCIAVGR